MGQQDVGASIGTSGVPSSPDWALVTWLCGSGVGWVVWGAACASLPVPACTRLHPHAVCLHLPTHPCLCSYTAHPCLRASWRCLHSHPAYTCPPTLTPCLLLPTGPSHSEAGGRVPPSLLGVLIPRASGAGDRDGDLASSGHIPAPVPAGVAVGAVGGGAWRRLPDSSFIMAASPGHGGKARLDFKLENKPGLLRAPTPALLLCQGPGCPHLLPAHAASPLLQMGKLRHRAPPCPGAVTPLGQPRALPCPVC